MLTITSSGPPVDICGSQANSPGASGASPSTVGAFGRAGVGALVTAALAGGVEVLAAVGAAPAGAEGWASVWGESWTAGRAVATGAVAEAQAGNSAQASRNAEQPGTGLNARCGRNFTVLPQESCVERYAM